jgi:hypothetical protein
MQDIGSNINHQQESKSQKGTHLFSGQKGTHLFSCAVVPVAQIGRQVRLGGVPAQLSVCQRAGGRRIDRREVRIQPKYSGSPKAFRPRHRCRITRSAMRSSGVRNTARRDPGGGGGCSGNQDRERTTVRGCHGDAERTRTEWCARSPFPGTPFGETACMWPGQSRVDFASPGQPAILARQCSRTR